MIIARGSELRYEADRQRCSAECVLSKNEHLYMGGIDYDVEKPGLPPDGHCGDVGCAKSIVDVYDTDIR